MASNRKSHPAAWRPRDETYDRHVQAAIENARVHGFGIPNYWRGIESYDRAEEIRRGLHRSRKHFNQSMTVKILDADDGTLEVEFTLYDKAAARAFIKDAGRWNGK
jgi:hypothetical protein